jgi:hypothetical protein
MKILTPRNIFTPFFFRFSGPDKYFKTGSKQGILSSNKGDCLGKCCQHVRLFFCGNVFGKNPMRKKMLNVPFNVFAIQKFSPKIVAPLRQLFFSRLHIL